MSNIAYDSDGFLANTSDWTESIALVLAQQEGLDLTPEHWEWIWLIRQFYDRYELSPSMRVLIKFAKSELGPDVAKSMIVMKLFGESPVKKLAKVAGLPKPPNCL